VKQITQRQRDERARRERMGIAVIQRPLKQILRATSTASSLYKAAKIEAANGQGHMVAQLARHAMDGGV